ncbi:hypothetical protein [Sinosporangium siamense]|uniref:Uncharacterized protein n=1 Tax=Sinosporangium siamense TaxID=1367973 RepID=A0A919RMF4_9ACTN|nr:hypothetical protein [Sinosporangium siamense]GII95877.1 hypothetical protein Ssi02_61080 [Sinosporangium siamense]
MSQASRLSWSALLVWGVAAAVAALPTWEFWRERLEAEEIARTFEASGDIYGMVCQYNAGTTLSPLAPLRRDLEVVMEITGGGRFRPSWFFSVFLCVWGAEIPA